MGKYLTTFQVQTVIGLNEPQKQTARQLVNLFFIGRPQLRSLNEPVTPAHSEAHYSLNRQRQVTLEVGLKSDGNYEVIKVVQK